MRFVEGIGLAVVASVVASMLAACDHSPVGRPGSNAAGVDAGARADGRAGPTEDSRGSAEPASETEAPPDIVATGDDAAASGDSSLDAGAETLTVAPAPYRALALAVGLTHVCVLLDDHNIKCWGDASSGALGYGDGNPRGATAAEMGDALPTVDLGTGRTVKEVSAGRYTTCAWLDDDSAKCWGIVGLDGQSGMNDRGDAPGEMGDALPPIPLPPGRSLTHLTAGTNWVTATLDDGTAALWQLGVRTILTLPTTSAVRQIARGREGGPTPILFEDGSTRLVAAGEISGPGPLGLPYQEPITFVADGRDDECVILAGGLPVCEGAADDPYDRWSDATVATRVAVGLEFSCVLQPNGHVRCRSSGLGGCEPDHPQNTYWCAGQAAADDSFEVLLGQPAVDVQAGDSFACALLVDGSVKCWGGGDDCVPYTRDGVSGYDCLAPAPPPVWLGGGISLVTTDGQTSYGPWHAVDLGTRK